MTILKKSRRLKKELNRFSLYTMATGATIASGFFLLPGLAFAQAGPAMLLSYLIAGILIVPAIFSMSELATAMPRAGGIYFFLDRSMGPMVGTIGGIGTWLALNFKIAFALVGLSVYMHLFFPQIPLLVYSCGFAVLFGLINLWGAKKSGIFQGVFVILLLFLLGSFLSSGIFQLRDDHFADFFGSGINEIFGGAGLVYVGFVGLSKIISISEEVKRPEKNIPIAMLLAFFTVLFVYLMGTMAMIGILPADQLQNNLTPVADAAKIIMGQWGRILMIIAAILAFFSVANVGILSASRYPLAMSRDHLLPRFLRNLNKQKTPQNSIYLTVVFIVLILFLFDPTKIAKLAGAFQLVLFSLIALAVIVMRESHIESYDPGFRSPLYPWMQIFGIIAPLWLILEMGWLPSLFSLGFMVIGVIWFFYFSRGKVSRSGAIYHIFARLGQNRFEGLDSELRGILKEKGVRDHDPFDYVVAHAGFIDVSEVCSFEEIVDKVSQLLSKKVHHEPEILKRTFLEGTQVGATPVSHGIALPHLRLSGIEHSELIMVRCRSGIKIHFESDLRSSEGANEPIYALFFLASSDENPGQHLRILAQIASHVDDEQFLGKWLSTRDEQGLKELMLQHDRYLSLEINTGSKTASLAGKQIKDLDLPKGSLIALIHRNGQMVIPQGSTILEQNDRLTVLSYPKGIQELKDKYV